MDSKKLISQNKFVKLCRFAYGFFLLFLFSFFLSTLYSFSKLQKSLEIVEVLGNFAFRLIYLSKHAHHSHEHCGRLERCFDVSICIPRNVSMYPFIK